MIHECASYQTQLKTARSCRSWPCTGKRSGKFQLANKYANASHLQYLMQYRVVFSDKKARLVIYSINEAGLIGSGFIPAKTKRLPVQTILWEVQLR